MANGKECIAVRPAKREHTDAAGKLFSGMVMVIKTRKKFDLLGAGTVVS